jgi:hypothetical protein
MAARRRERVLAWRRPEWQIGLEFEPQCIEAEQTRVREGEEKGGVALAARTRSSTGASAMARGGRWPEGLNCASSAAEAVREGGAEGGEARARAQAAHGDAEAVAERRCMELDDDGSGGASASVLREREREREVGRLNEGNR